MKVSNKALQNILGNKKEKLEQFMLNSVWKIDMQSSDFLI